MNPCAAALLLLRRRMLIAVRGGWDSASSGGWGHCYFFSPTASYHFLKFRVACHQQPFPTNRGGWSHFLVVTVKGRRSCLLMAPGACGTRLANQCESTSGTSLAQTISLSAHSASCQRAPPSLFAVRFPSRPGTPVHAHMWARHFPKHSQSSWHPGLLSPFYPPTCPANSRGAKGQRQLVGVRELGLEVGGIRGEFLYELPKFGEGIDLVGFWQYFVL